MSDSNAYISLLRALTPPLDDTGHAPACGYTDEQQECGCIEMGARLWRWVGEHVAQVRRNVSDEIALAIEEQQASHVMRNVTLQRAAAIAREIGRTR